jgi:LuxR family transcriptional regulator, maltose regulon positive regulatory protein
MRSVAAADAVVLGAAGSGGGGVVARARLVERLGAARVSVVSAPAGSGKTVLLRSWIGQDIVAARAGWVPIGRGEGDPQPFWLSVLTALRHTRPGSTLVQPLSAAPDLDGWAIVERLLADLAPLSEPVWLVIDDVHELDQETLLQLELLITRALPQLRFVLAARHDLRLGLHRLRLEGELVEIRGPDLCFTMAEAEELFANAGVDVPGLATLVEQTEGWAAGLRLAALSLVGHPEPARFDEQFSGTERTVAEYLLAEVLDRQPEPVRRLLLRTSILDSVNGELADLLTGESGGERILQDLEAANAFVVPVDEGGSRFRFHHLFADLLQRELRRSEPDEVSALHRQAADWLARHGQPVQAIQHAQAAQEWEVAAEMLADHWPAFHLDGQGATAHDLLAGFSLEMQRANAELQVLTAIDELTQGSLETAEQYLGRASLAMAAVPAARQAQAQLLLGIARLLHARQRGNRPAVAEEARQLQAMAEVPKDVHTPLGEELRALALISLGITEYWTAMSAQAMQHLDQGRELAHRIARPYLEFTGLAYQATAEFFQSFAVATEHSRRCIELAELHGWNDDPAASIASATLGLVLSWQERPDEAEPWVQRAERTLRAESQPGPQMLIAHVRGVLELARGQNAEALAAFRAVEPLAGRLTAPNPLVLAMRALQLFAQVRLGGTARAEQALTGVDAHDLDLGELRMALAALRLTQGDPHAATSALAPVLDGSAPMACPPWLAQAFLLEASAQDVLGNADAAGQALELALDLAEPNGAVLPFLLQPMPDLLERHARQHTAHAALIADIISLLAGRAPAAPAEMHPPLVEPLTDSEVRVLCYLPTNLTAPEIADQLCVSVTTVKTHMHHLYTKLGVHRRTDAVARARALGLLAPTPLRANAAPVG